MQGPNQTAEQMWQDGIHMRDYHLRRAIEASQLTIPILIPNSDQWTSSTPYIQNEVPSLYQGQGGRGLSSLASKLLLVLYPPNEPHFRIQLNEGLLAEYLQGLDPGQQSQEKLRLDQALASFERQVLKKMESLSVRGTLAELLQHLLCGGNTMAYMGLPRMHFFPFRSFVWRMDMERNIRMAIIRETVWPQFLPEGVVDQSHGADDGYYRQQKDIYTLIEVDPKAKQPGMQVTWHQEYEGRKVPGSNGSSPIDGSPWIMSRLVGAAGEPYSRNFLETSCLGDLQSLEELSKGIVTGSLAGLKRLFRTSPNSYLSPRQITEAQTGDCLVANEGDAGEIGDPGRWGAAVQSLAPVMQQLLDRTGKEFLLTESVQRDAERVTAEEIQTMARALDQDKGGLYSLLVSEVQMPVVKAVINMMTRDGELPELPPDIADVQIIGGLDAIGRANEVTRLNAFAQLGQGLVGPDQYMVYVKPAAMLQMAATNTGIDGESLLKTEEEIEAERAEAERKQLQAMLAQSAGANGNGNGNRRPGPGGATAPARGSQ